MTTKNKTKMLLSVNETRILQLIPIGDGFIKVHDIMTITGIDERQIYFYLNSMKKKGIPICSIRQRDAGIFIPGCEEQRIKGLQAMRSQYEEMRFAYECVNKADLKEWSDNIVYSFQDEVF